VASNSKTSLGRAHLLTELSERLGRELATSTVLFHHAVAARLGLSATDLKCLDLLRANQIPLTASNLVRLTGLTGGAITGVIDRLEAAGFAERVRDSADRRRWELRPKLDRQAEITSLFAPLTEAITGLCSDYSDDQLELLTEFLTQLNGLMIEQTQQLRT
jgi:DNA-binding MarR family transcriptional regulator